MCTIIELKITLVYTYISFVVRLYYTFLVYIYGEITKCILFFNTQPKATWEIYFLLITILNNILYWISSIIIKIIAFISGNYTILAKSSYFRENLNGWCPRRAMNCHKSSCLSPFVSTSVTFHTSLGQLYFSFSSGIKAFDWKILVGKTITIKY